MATKRQLEADLRAALAEVEGLRQKLANLKAGKPVVRYGSREFVAVEKIEQQELLGCAWEVASGMCGEGRARNEVRASEADKYGSLDLLSCDYQAVYDDFDGRISPVRRWWLIDYHYDREDGTSINEVWALVEV